MIKNETLDTILTRASARAYLPDPPTKEQMDALMAAALAAPSAVNAQPWRVICLTNQALIKEMEQDIVDYYRKLNDTAMVERLESRNNKVFYDAPLVVYVPIANTVYAPVDCGILIQNLALAAKSVGLESVIIAMSRILFMGDKADYWKQKLSFPEDFIFGCSIAIGKPNGPVKEPHELDYSKVSFVE